MFFVDYRKQKIINSIFKAINQYRWSETSLFIWIWIQIFIAFRCVCTFSNEYKFTNIEILSIFLCFSTNNLEFFVLLYSIELKISLFLIITILFIINFHSFKYKTIFKNMCWLKLMFFFVLFDVHCFYFLRYWIWIFFFFEYRCLFHIIQKKFVSKFFCVYLYCYHFWQNYFSIRKFVSTY